MIDLDSTSEIIAIYTKHGWMLRRILLTPKSKTALKRFPDDLFGNERIIESAIDAAWFSRPPKPGGVAWELRYLGNTPFSLVERVDENAADFESTLSDVEDRLRAAIAVKESA